MHLLGIYLEGEYVSGSEGMNTSSGSRERLTVVFFTVMDLQSHQQYMRVLVVLYLCVLLVSVLRSFIVWLFSITYISLMTK